MNQKQREQKLADEMVAALENGEHDTGNSDQMATRSMGDAIRQSATQDLPMANPELRELVCAELDRVSTGNNVPTKPVKVTANPRRWVLAASLLLVLSGLIAYVALNSIDHNSRSLALTNFSADSEIASSDDGRQVVENRLSLRPGDMISVEEVRKSERRLDSTKVFAPAAIESSSNSNQISGYKTVDPATVVSVPDGGTVLLGGIKREAITSGLPAAPVPSTVRFNRGGAYNSDSGTNLANVPRQQSAQTAYNLNYLYQTPSAPAANLNGKSPSTVIGRNPLHPQQSAAASKESLTQGKLGELIVLDNTESFGRHSFGLEFDDAERGFREGRRSLWNRQTNTEQYDPITENQFIGVRGEAARSTFSIDVDTASYANMRRFINANQLPPHDAVRIEEFVNYFDYDYAGPKGDDPFAVNMELASCPWNTEHKLLRIGLKGKDVHRDERPATNIVFLIDVSGSMNSPDKLPLLKRGFQMMVNKLNENDTVSIVTYAGNAGCVLEPTRGDQTKKINEAIEKLTPGGSTNGSAGIELAYELAQKNFVQDGVNKVILATDGDLNVGVTSDGALVKLISEKASEGVFLTVLGFGTGNLKDSKLEKLADNGNGMYSYIDGIRQAHRILVEQMSGSLVTIAKDVKIQLEFNPAEVLAYRLIGYENRVMANKDFDNDAKDAGEIGAGHTVTALYELVTTGEVGTLTAPTPQGLKYQQADPVVREKPEAKANLSDAARTGEMLTLAIRYKQPDSNVSKRIEFTTRNDEQSFDGASNDFRFAASVAAFGMLLRGSKYSGSATPDTVLDLASGSIGDDTSGYRAEFIDLVRRAGAFE